MKKGKREEMGGRGVNTQNKFLVTALQKRMQE